MSDPYLSEIRIVAFNFPPKGWAFCNGQFLPINQNQALFSLLGTTYGGNGVTTFQLPDLRDRMPEHWGNGRNLGERAGEVNHTLTIAEMPVHTHAQSVVDKPGTSATPAGNFLAAHRGGYTEAAAANTAFSPAAVANVGGSQPHNNMPPYLTLNFCIALVGIFPSRN